MPIEDPASTLITLGLVLLASLGVDAVGRLSGLPRVSLLLVLGLLIGPAGAGWLPAGTELFELLTQLALVMVGFLLGEQLAWPALRQRGARVLWVSLSVVVSTFALVLSGLLLAKVDPALALLLAAVSTATAPAAVHDVVHELRSDSPFARLLLGVVAIDDAWGLIVFSGALAAAAVLTGSTTDGVWELAGRDLLGAVAVGTALGLPAAALTGRVQPGEPTVLEALGVVLLCGGLALWLQVSLVLTAMTCGAVVASVTRHHEHTFAAIGHLERPFLIFFFVSAGASLDVRALAGLGGIGLLYITLRVLGRLTGGWLGALAAGSAAPTRRWIGPALLPQAGVALGMALLAAERFPALGAQLLPLVVASTVVFELAGPPLTRLALLRTGDPGAAPRG